VPLPSSLCETREILFQAVGAGGHFGFSAFVAGAGALPSVGGCADDEPVSPNQMSAPTISSIATTQIRVRRRALDDIVADVTTCYRRCDMYMRCSLLA